MLVTVIHWPGSRLLIITSRNHTSPDHTMHTVNRKRGKILHRPTASFFPLFFHNILPSDIRDLHSVKTPAPVDFNLEGYCAVATRVDSPRNPRLKCFAMGITQGPFILSHFSFCLITPRTSVARSRCSVFCRWLLGLVPLGWHVSKTNASQS